MAIREKTRRRLRILLIVGLGICVLGGGGYVLRKKQVAARVLRDRDAGYAALDQKDYFTAMHKIGPYVQRNPQDAEPMLKYAIARSHVEEPNGRHVVEAISLYRRVLELQPENAEAREQLLELYIAARFNTEILSATDGRSDPPSLRARAIALANLGRDPESLKIAQAYNDAKPSDLKMQMFSCAQMLRTRAANDQVVDRAAKLQQAHPDDPRFQLLVAFAKLSVGQKAEALDWTRRAAAHPMNEPELIDATVDQFDRLEQYDEALQVLRKAAAVEGNIDFRRQVIARIFQSGDYSAVAQQLQPLEKDLSKADTELLALRAMALGEIGQASAGKTIVDALAARKNDFAALGWSKVLGAVPPQSMSGESVAPDERAILDTCREALKSQQANPYFHLFLGDSYARLGEAPAAMQEWSAAARSAPVWAAPQARILRALLGQSSPADVEQVAQRIEKLAPNDARSLATVAWARASIAKPPMSADQLKTVLALIDRAQQIRPGEEWSLALKVKVLATSDHRQEAQGVVDSLVGSSKPEAAALLAVARASAESKLGAEQVCLDRFQALFGSNPESASLRAEIALRSGGARADVLKRFDTDRSASAHGNDARWGLKRAQLQDRIASDAAATAAGTKQWVELAAANPDDPMIHQSVIASPAAQLDRDLVRRSIDALKQSLGDDGVAWKVADARWMMQAAVTAASKSEREQDLTKAAATLSQLTRRYAEFLPARLLLSECLYRLDNKQAASEQLVAAAKLAPDSFDVSFQLASLLQSMGDFDKAKPYLDQAEQILKRSDALRQPLDGSATPANAQIESPSAAPAGRTTVAANPLSSGSDVQWRSVAQLYAARGETEHAIDILKRIDSEKQPASTNGESAAASSDPRMLEMLASRGMLSDDDCRRLLTEHPTPQAVGIVASYYATAGRTDEAQKAIARLDSMSDSTPGERACVRGLYYLRCGENEKAAEQLRAACDAAPSNAEWWRTLVITHFQSGNADKAIAAVRDAQHAVPNDAGFNRAVSQEKLIRQIADMPLARPLLLPIVSSSDKDVDTAISTLTVIQNGRSSDKPISQVAAELKPLADRAPAFLPLQYLLIDLDFQLQNFDEAASIATRSMRLVPSDPQPAQRAAEALAAGKRWDQLASVAGEWRKRLGARTMPADETLALALIGQHDYAAARTQLEPYRDSAARNPAANSRVIALYSQALFGMGRVSDAKDYLEPMLADSPLARSTWMSLACGAIPDTSVGSEWLHNLEPKIPADAKDELVALAAAWCQLSTRAGSSNTAIRESAQTALRRATDAAGKGNATADQWFALGMLCETFADEPGAEADYRAALKVRADHASSQNNLAMILFRRGDLNGAAELATKAASHNENPYLGNFLDTLAQIQTKQHDFAAAENSIKKAMQIEPKNPSFRWSFVQALVDGGKSKEANAALSELEQMLSQAAHPDPQLVAKVSQLRSQMQKVSSSS